MTYRCLLTITLFLGCTISTIAQKNRFTTKIMDADSIAVQSVITIKNADSVVLQQSLTDSTGIFRYTLKEGSYILQAEAVGFTPLNVPFIIKAGRSGLPGKIILSPDFKDLESVVVVAKKPPIVIKTDTTEFNVTAVKTGCDATVEDIFQKLPGLEVNKNGSIKANGETITQIYVDGKPFFGTDIKAVTQNFPADMIEKIQVIDKKTDQSADDGSYEKIINVILKKNRRQGFFGNNNMGYGTGKHYEAKANANYLHYDTKLSLIANAANTGVNNSGGQEANAPGDLKSSQFKLSFAGKPAERLDLSAWMGFEKHNNTVLQYSNRQNIYGDSVTFYREQANSNNISGSLTSGIYLEYKPDSFSVLKIQQQTGYNKNSFDNSGNSETTASNNTPVNKGVSAGSGKTTSPWLNGTVNYNRKLGYSGRNLSIDFSNRLNTYESSLYTIFNNSYYPADSNDTFLQNRFQYQQTKNKNLTASAAYTEPVGNRGSVNAAYGWYYNTSDLPRELYDYNNVTGLYDLLLIDYSNHFNNISQSGTASVSYQYKTKKTGFSAGLRWKHAAITSSAFDKDSSYTRSFNGLLPNASFYKTGKALRFNIDYNMYIRAPEAIQLQPVIDNTNPLFTRLGNPSLQYTLVQTLQYKLNWFSLKKETGINARANFSMLSDNISNNLVYDAATGKQTSTPVNMQGAYNWNAWCSFYKPIHIAEDKIKWNLNLSGSGAVTTSLLNGENNTGTHTTMRVLTGFAYDAKSWIDLRTNFSYTKQNNRYSLQNNRNLDARYIAINPVITLRPMANTEINIDYDHRSVNSNTDVLDNNVNLFNANIKQYIGEKKTVAICLKAFDLFNENNNTWRSYGDNFIQDNSLNAQSRFLLLSVNFKLQHFN